VLFGTYKVPFDPLKAVSEAKEKSTGNAAVLDKMQHEGVKDDETPFVFQKEPVKRGRGGPASPRRSTSTSPRGRKK
jgi:hypothetical protein